MPTLKIPFIGSYNNRSFADIPGVDQCAKGCVLTPISNKQSRTATYYVEKRSGLIAQFTPSSGSTAYGVYYSPSTAHTYSIFYDATNMLLFDSVAGPTNINCGILNVGLNGFTSFSEVILGGITYILIRIAQNALLGTGWYLASDSTTPLTFTGTTHSNTTMDGIGTTVGMYSGQAISGSGIPANDRIASVDSGTSITLTIAATTSVSATFTREAVAKIIDSDFPSDIVGGFAELDGYVNVMTFTSKVYQSDLNSVSSWGANNYLTCSKYSDNGIGVYRYKSNVVAFSRASIEFLYNAGLPSGSTMLSSDNAIGSKFIPPVSHRAVAVAEGVLYWVGVDGNVYKMVGVTPQKLNSYGTGLNSGVTTVTAFSYNKKTYLNITYTPPSGAVSTYWYGTDDDSWVDPLFGAVTSFATFGAAGLTYFVLGDTTGKIYGISDNLGTSTVFLDNAATQTMRIRLQTDMGTNLRKIPTQLRIEADIQTTGNLAISYSDDNGATYSTARNIDLTKARMQLSGQLGSFVGTRLWKYEHTDNAPFRGRMIEIDYELQQS